MIQAGHSDGSATGDRRPQWGPDRPTVGSGGDTERRTPTGLARNGDGAG
jgi:hypothetical protein